MHQRILIAVALGQMACAGVHVPVPGLDGAAPQIQAAAAQAQAEAQRREAQQQQAEQQRRAEEERVRQEEAQRRQDEARAEADRAEAEKVRQQAEARRAQLELEATQAREREREQEQAARERERTDPKTWSASGWQHYRWRMGSQDVLDRARSASAGEIGCSGDTYESQSGPGFWCWGDTQIAGREVSISFHFFDDGALYEVIVAPGTFEGESYAPETTRAELKWFETVGS